MYQNVVFDLDGTLLDTLQDLAAAGNHALAAMHLPTHSAEAYKKMVGNGINKLIERMLPKINRGEATQKLALQIFNSYYSAHNKQLTTPYPGIMKMLENLVNAGVLLGIASNKDHAFVQELSQDFFGDIFVASVGLKDGAPPKPNPACVNAALLEMGAKSGKALYVGDSGVDMQTAKNAGLCACGVLWGFRQKEELLQNGANFIVNSPKELEELILGFAS